MTVNEPVLVMAFNRPDHFSVLLDRLREVQPTRVFVAIDGPRVGREGEEDKVRACHDLISTIDWPCDVQTLFQQVNLGCGLGVTTAITWFFSHIERGIILEDDIIPDPSFFGYCTELLDRYEHDSRVFAISGCNFVPPEFQSHPGDAYRFSQVPHIWGWATWKRSWEKHQLDIAGWSQQLSPGQLWKRSGRSIPGALYWASTFELLARKQVDTWDGQFVLASMVSNQLTATSNVNLIRNIGFGEFATHTVQDRDELQPITAMALPMGPVDVTCDELADAWTRRHHFRATWHGMLGQARTFVGRKVGRSQ